jgi:hypothetical protein
MASQYRLIHERRELGATRALFPLASGRAVQPSAPKRDAAENTPVQSKPQLQSRHGYLRHAGASLRTSRDSRDLPWHLYSKTRSSGWPSINFLIGNSCFLPERVRGISETAIFHSGQIAATVSF